MAYVDVFAAAVPTANREKYLEHATAMSQVFKDHGALSVIECWGDDVPEGKLNSLHTAVLREADETVAVGWVTWPDKAARDAGWAACMQDERMMAGVMPFDGKRLIFGGFETILSA